MMMKTRGKTTYTKSLAKRTREITHLLNSPQKTSRSNQKDKRREKMKSSLFCFLM